MRKFKVRMEIVTNSDLFVTEGRMLQRFIFTTEEKAKEVFDLVSQAIRDYQDRANDCHKAITFSDDTGLFTIPSKNLVSVRTVDNDAWNEFHRECVHAEAAIDAEAKKIQE